MERLSKDLESAKRGNTKDVLIVYNGTMKLCRWRGFFAAERMVDMENDVLLAASTFSNACGIPLSKVIAFVESFQQKEETRAANTEKRVEKYAAQQSKKIHTLIRESEQDDGYSDIDIPKGIKDAYIDSRMSGY